MPRRRTVIALGAALLASASIAAAQQAPRFFPGYANICSTPYGWCPLDPNLAIVVGTPCRCQAYNGQVFGGQTRQFPYQNYGRPVSPYLNPHWSDPPPPPPVIK